MSCFNVFTLKATLATVKSILAPQSNSLDVVAAHKGALSLNKHLHIAARRTNVRLSPSAK